MLIWLSYSKIAYTIPMLFSQRSFSFSNTLPFLFPFFTTTTIHFDAVGLVNQTTSSSGFEMEFYLFPLLLWHLFWAQKSINDTQRKSVWLHGKEKKKKNRVEREEIIFTQMRLLRTRKNNDVETCTHSIAIKNILTHIRLLAHSFIHASGYTSEINILFVAINSFLLL